MFCTSLRRRSFDFTHILPKLTAPSGLGLRENDLKTHDISLYIGPNNGVNTRQLRVLLLSPSAILGNKLQRTVERMQHLVHLSGGQDIAIVFLISPPPGARFASARTLLEPPEDHGTNGMLAYCRLQAELTSHPELNVAILPLPTLDSISDLLQSHLTAIGVPLKVQPPAKAPFQLLQHCTTAPPLRQQTAFLLSDSFENLRGFAEGCCMLLNSAPELGSSSSFADSSLESDSEGDVKSKLKRLCHLIDTKEWENMVVFWQQEWAME